MIFGTSAGSSGSCHCCSSSSCRAPGASRSRPDEAFLAALGELREAELRRQGSDRRALIATGHASAGAVLTAMLEDRLFATADQTGRHRHVDRREPDGLRADRSGLADAAPAPRRRTSLTKIGTNNRLRRFLRTTVARFALASPDASVRLGRRAGHGRARSTRPPSSCSVQRAGSETDAAVRARSRPRWRWRRSTASDAERSPAGRGHAVGSPQHRRAQSSRGAGRAGAGRQRQRERCRGARGRDRRPCSSIDSTRSLYSGVETLFFGLSLGSVLVLVAIGLAITFGVMGVINMAHGELMMLGAYTTYVVQMAMPESHRAGRFRWPFRPRSSSPASPACCSSARSSGFSTAGRSRRCWRRSASAWCCSSWCGRCSRPTTAPSRRRRG